MPSSIRLKLTCCIDHPCVIRRCAIVVCRCSVWAYLAGTVQQFFADVFFMNGIGFNPEFGYVRFVSVELQESDFIFAIASRARELSKFS